MGQGPTVFVVDDDPAARNGLRFLLGSADLSVRTFASAEDFLDDLPSLGDGCLLLDNQLPGMSGIELIARIETAQPKLPIIMITGKGSDQVRTKALDAGVFAYLEKPLDDSGLLPLIRRACALSAQQRSQFVN